MPCRPGHFKNIFNTFQNGHFQNGMKISKPDLVWMGSGLENGEIVAFSNSTGNGTTL
jgi:hypothetical protein